MPLYSADLHSHVDYDAERGNWHGERPEVFAQRIVENTRLDIIAITEHNMVTDRYFDTRDEIERLLDLEAARTGTRRSVRTLLGAELTVMFDRNRYHMGYIYEQDFQTGDLPEMPPLRTNARDLEHYTIDYPGIRILNHPTWKDRCPADAATTEAFMDSGLVDGVEIANGSMLYNGNDQSVATREACAMFIRARRRQRRQRRNADDPVQFPLLGAIGSSDAHRAPLLGSIVTVFDGQNPQELFQAVRRGRTRAMPLEPLRVVPRLAAVRGSLPGLEWYIQLPEPGHGTPSAAQA